MNKNIKTWLRGLVSTAISSAAGGVALVIVDPSTFNFHGGLKKLAEVCAALVLVHIAAYLQKSPIWDDPTDNSAPPNNSGGTVKSLAFIAVLLLSAASLRAQTAPSPASLFSAASEVTALNYKGQWGVANHTIESFDLIDFGAKKTNSLAVEGHQLVAPVAGFGAYLGGVRITPDVSKLLAKTNIPAGSFGLYFEGAAGVGNLSTGNTYSFLAGGGVQYRVSKSLTWSSLHAGWVKVGSQGGVELSTGLKYFFGK